MLQDIRDKQLDFLLENCDTTIEHLLLSHSSHLTKSMSKGNLSDLLSLPSVRYWMESIPNQINTQTVLGSSDGCFENAFGKLLSYGLTANEIVNEDLYKQCLAFISNHENKSIYDPIARQVVTSYLLASGYVNHILIDKAQVRVENLYQAVTKMIPDYNIYADTKTLKIPKQYKSKKLIHPQLYEGNELVLPLIYDVYMFGVLYNITSIEVKEKIVTILDYIVNDKYQDLDYGYGIIRTPDNKFHSIGWSAHLPLYNKAQSENYFKKGLIHRMGLFSKFNHHGIQTWLQNILEAFEPYKLDGFKYCLPSELLPEIKNSYFMHGRHTGLNENRRKKSGKVIESTYYIYTATRYFR